jgi:putative transcriptional regulator
MQLKCNLSTLMGKNRYSIKDVHERSGLSRNTISSLYYDKVKRIDYDTVVKLCKTFKCDVNDLLSLNTEDEYGNKETKGEER